jgi:hypothetical protein
MVDKSLYLLRVIRVFRILPFKTVVNLLGNVKHKTIICKIHSLR